MDLVGDLRGEVTQSVPYPTPEQVIAFVREGIPALSARMDDAQRERIAGLGIAMPFELSKWEEEVGAPPGALDGWQTVDLPAEIETIAQVPVHVSNDATAACAAEYLFGHGTRCRELLYIFVAWFIGGGVVLDGNLFPGKTGYAGSLGQVLVPTTRGGRAGATQLLHVASLYLLARDIEAKGGNPSAIWEHPDDWTSLEPFLDGWIDRAAKAIAHASVSSVALAEFQAVVIDGIFPAAIRSRLVARVRHYVAALDCRGLPAFEILEGSIGSRARAIGGASLPLLAKFMRDHELLVHEPPDGHA
jgi:predicted NBD/HSP70 family sugar kinase